MWKTLKELLVRERWTRAVLSAAAAALFTRAANIYLFCVCFLPHCLSGKLRAWVTKQNTALCVLNFIIHRRPARGGPNKTAGLIVPHLTFLRVSLSGESKLNMLVAEPQLDDCKPVLLGIIWSETRTASFSQAWTMPIISCPVCYPIMGLLHEPELLVRVSHGGFINTLLLSVEIWAEQRWGTLTHTELGSQCQQHQSCPK